MLFAAYAAYTLSTHILNAQVDRLTISQHNAEIISRAYKSTALSYLLVGLCMPFLLVQNLEILEKWWILEIFIFWNLRSAFIYYNARKRFQCWNLHQ